MEDMYLIVDDVEAARDDLIGHGADVSEIWHGRGVGTSGHEPGPDPQRQSYRSFASFADPDGNRWLLQEITQRLPGRSGAGGRRGPRAVCCTRPPSITAPSRRPPRRTTGGTGTRPTWTPASAAPPRTRRPRPPGATWRRSSTSSSVGSSRGPAPASRRRVSCDDGGLVTLLGPHGSRWRRSTGRGWLNSEPLTADGLRGTSSSSTSGRTRASTGCARCRTSARGPSVRDRGLVVVGVHAPEFGFEHDVGNVRHAATRPGRRLPGRHRQRLRHLAGVRGTTTGRPLYLVDGEGRIRLHHFGEGAYEETERAIQQVLGVDEEPARVDAGGIAEPPPTGTRCGRPRDLPRLRPRGERSTSPDRSSPSPMRWATGRSARRTPCSRRTGGRSRTASTRATSTWSSRRRPRRTRPLRVRARRRTARRRPRPRRRRATATGTSAEPRMYRP